ncbi:MAG: hypothetical protein ABFD65_11235, partial [Candidatus Polarisedimenticolia bacterium]
MALFGGVLNLSYPATAELPVEHGWRFGLTLAENSNGGFQTVVHSPSSAPTKRSVGIETVLQGRSWVGFGWKLQVGRIFDANTWDPGHCSIFANPDTCMQDECDLNFPQSYATESRRLYEDEHGTQIELGPLVDDRELRYETSIDGAGKTRLTLTKGNGTRYEFEEIVAADRQQGGHALWGGYIFNESRAGYYVTRIADVYGNAITVDYYGGDNPRYPEAIRRIEYAPDGAARWAITTTLWQAGDCGAGRPDCPSDSIVGMLRTLTYTGPGGLPVSRDFFYETVTSNAARNGGPVPVLARMVLPPDERGVRPEYRFKYGRGGEATAMKSDPVSYPIAVKRIDYPTGGATLYKYGLWIGRSVPNCIPISFFTGGGGFGTYGDGRGDVLHNRILVDGCDISLAAKPTGILWNECSATRDPSTGETTQSCTTHQCAVGDSACNAANQVMSACADDDMACDPYESLPATASTNPLDEWEPPAPNPNPCAVLSTCDEHVNGWRLGYNGGVVSRTVFPAGTGSGAEVDWAMPHATTRWNRAFYLTGIDSPTSSTGVRTTNEFEMINPDGSREVSQFSGSPDGSMGDEGLVASTNYYDAAGNLIRRKEFQYDGEGGVRPSGKSELKNPLVKETTTFFLDDKEGADCLASSTSSTRQDAPFIRETNSERTQVGAAPGDRWRKTVVDGSYVERAPDGTAGSSIEYTHYEDLDAGTSRGAANVFGAYDYHFSEYGGRRAARCYSFDGKGAMTSETGVVALAAAGGATTCSSVGSAAGDLLTTADYDSKGNLANYVFGGGDVLPGATAHSYTVNYSWRNGVAVSMGISGQNYLLKNQQADEAGFVSSALDPNGLESRYTYDALGRVKSIEPPTGEQTTQIAYPDFTKMLASRANSAKRELDPSDATQSFSETIYDGLGRPVEQRKALPDGSLAVQLTRHDQMGRVVFVSEWMEQAQYGNAARVPSWHAPDRDGDGTADYVIDDIPADGSGRPLGTVTFYGTPSADAPDDPLQASADAMGRPTEVRAVDGKRTTTRYCGPHKEVTTSVATAPGSESDVSARYYYDGLGRLALVDVAPFGGSGVSPIAADASYRYDVFGKIRKATLAGNLPSAPFWAWRDGTDPAGQVRRFEYDGLGRLRREQLPEESGTAVPQQTSPPVRTCTVSGGGNGPIGTNPVDPDDPDSGGDGTTRTPPQVTCTETPGAPLPDQWTEIDRQYLAYDAWGNLLAWQDALGQKRGYFFQNDYDVAGRITAAWRTIGVPGSPSAAVERIASATPDFGTISASSQFVVSGTGTMPSLWKPAALGQGNCPAAPPTGGTSAFSTGLCAYSSVKGTADAVRFAATGATRDDVLKFLHWRDVRAGSGSHDQFSVWVTLQTAGADVASPRVLFTSSDAQPSFKAWIAAPPIRPGDVFTADEWPEGATRDIYVYFVFKKGDTSATSGKGVVVTNVSLGRPSSELLASYGYDEDHCATGAAAAACADATGRANAPLGRQTTVRSYEAGTATSVRRLVYRGLGGRPSASQEWLNWSGVPAAESAWPSWASATSYATSGAPNGWTAPHAAGTSGNVFAVDLARDYALRVRDASSGTTYAEARASGTASSPYDAAGLPRAIAFGNGVLQTIARDARHRPSGIVVQGPAGSVLWDTGTYAYDGAGMIEAIGTQRYAYDAAGRLVYAEAVPQAAGGNAADVETFGYDLFGNLKSRAVQAAAGRTAPAAESASLDFDASSSADGSTNRNQVVRRAVLDNAGAPLKDANGQPVYAKDFSYDANGNATRFLGLLATPAGGFWDPQNRMTVFVQGDPQAAKATPAEQYRYDAAGTRWLRLDKSGLPRLTLRDGAGQALAEYTVSPASGGGGTVAAAKEYVPGFGGVVAERTWTTSMGTLPKVTFHQRDHLGSLRLVTDATGAVVEAHDYYPFGGEMGPVGASSRRKFTGHERDEE